MKIAEVDYGDMKFEYISNHWDIHLGGLCWYNGKLCRFETVDERDYECNPLHYEWYEWNGEKHQIEVFRETGRLYCNIYSMSFVEKFKKQWRRFWFEFCVGHHWSYPNRKNRDYSDWKPRWLRKILRMLYYRNFKWPRTIAGDSL